MTFGLRITVNSDTPPNGAPGDPPLLETINLSDIASESESPNSSVRAEAGSVRKYNPWTDSDSDSDLLRSPSPQQQKGEKEKTPPKLSSIFDYDSPPDPESNSSSVRKRKIISSGDEDYCPSRKKVKKTPNPKTRKPRETVKMVKEKLAEAERQVSDLKTTTTSQEEKIEKLRELLKEHFRCGICLKKPKNAQMLRCGHYLCRRCLDEMIEHRENYYEGRLSPLLITPACPICRAEIYGPSIHLHWMDTFLGATSQELNLGSDSDTDATGTPPRQVVDVPDISPPDSDLR